VDGKQRSHLESLVTSVLNRFLALAEAGETDQVKTLAFEAYADESYSEHVLAYVAGVVYERQIEGTIELIYEFNNRYPESFHPIGVFLANLYARSERFDEATLEARLYLRRVRDAELLTKLAEHQHVEHGVSMGFLLVTSAYTQAGARSYSRSILEMAQHLIKNDHWTGVYQSELQQLNDELNDKANQALDAKWNDLFEGGSHVAELSKHCEDKNFPTLAKHVSCIESNFRYNAEYSINAESVFDVLVAYEDGNTFGLR